MGDTVQIQVRMTPETVTRCEAQIEPCKTRHANEKIRRADVIRIALELGLRQLESLEAAEVSP